MTPTQDPDTHVSGGELMILGRLDPAGTSAVAVRPSPIGQRGVFSTVDLAAGATVFRFGFVREVTAAAPLRPDLDEHPEHCPRIDGRLLLVAPPGRYLNHSCDPNVYLRFAADLEPVHVVTRRAVPAGAELTLDYLINNAGGDSWPCACGAPRCRGRTGTSFFELPAPLQREYAAHLAPWFRRRHAERLRHLPDTTPA